MLAASSAPLQAGPSRFHSNSVSSRTRHLHPRGGSVAGSHPIHPPSNSQGQCTQPEIQAAAPGTHHLVTAASPVSSTVSSNARLRKVVRKMLQLLMQGSHTRIRQPQRNLWGASAQEWASPMAMGLVCPVLPGGGFQDILSNRVLITGFIAWFAAQFGKVFTWRFKKGVWDLRAIVQPGGMPSSHSSLCAGVTTALALQEGLSSPIFAVSVAFSVIVMYDAMGVRQHAGKQAAVLNQVVTEIFHKNPAIGDIKLKEVLGHTPRQVLCGAVLGFVVAMCLPWAPAPLPQQ